MLSLANKIVFHKENHYDLNSANTVTCDKNEPVILTAFEQIESGLSICSKETQLTMKSILSFLCRENKYKDFDYKNRLAACELRPTEDRINEILCFHERITFTEMVENVLKAIIKHHIPFNEELQSPKAKPTLFMLLYSPLVRDQITSLCKAPSLSLIRDNYFNFTMEAFHIDASVFTRLSTPMEVTLEKDKIIEFMTDDKLNDRVLELQEYVAINGWKSLECPELSVVLLNIKKCIEVTLQKLEGKSQILIPILNELIKQAEVLTSKGEKIPYADTMCLCIKYSFIQTHIDLLDFPDSFFYATDRVKPSEDEILADCNTVLTQTLTQLPNKLDACKILRQNYSTNKKIAGRIEPIHDITRWIDSHPNLLMWPIVAPLTLTDFIKMSRYDVYHAGLSTGKASFHDGLIMLNNTLFAHDFAHARIITKNNKSKCNALPDSQKFSSQARQDFYEAVEYGVKKLNLSSDPMVLHAIDLTRFVAVHEEGDSNHYRITDTSQKESNYLSSRFDSHLFKEFAHYELHQDLRIEHVQIALFVMTLISFGQLYPDDFPELQPPKSDETASSNRNPATLGITFA